MRKVLSPAEQKEEIDKLMNSPWPLDPLCPVQRAAELPGAWPEFGVLYRHKLDRVYRCAVRDVARIYETLTPTAPDPNAPEGFSSFELTVGFDEVLTQEELEMRLFSINAYVYEGGIEDIVASGWHMD